MGFSTKSQTPQDTKALIVENASRVICIACVHGISNHFRVLGAAKQLRYEIHIDEGQVPNETCYGESDRNELALMLL